MAKVQISIDDILLKRVDDFAKKNFLSRSGLTSLALTEYINSKEVLNLAIEVSQLLRTSDLNSLTDEELSKIKEFERLTNFNK